MQEDSAGLPHYNDAVTQQLAMGHLVLHCCVTQELLRRKREALLDSLECLESLYVKPWARTSVDIAIQVGMSDGYLQCWTAVISDSMPCPPPLPRSMMSWNLA